MNPVRTGRGFTLIEIMIAIAIVALLTAIALPSYQEHVRKSRRAEGKSALLKTLQLQERAYTANATYVATAGLGSLYGLPTAGAEVRSGEDPSATGGGWYVITADTTDCTPADLTACVRVVATPRAGYVDAKCGTLTMNSRGVQTESGTESLQYCFR